MDGDFDVFYHFDSGSPAVVDGIMNIGVPNDGTYWLSLSNINIEYTGTPTDFMSGFISISGTQSNQRGIVIGGRSANRLLFAVSDPGSTKPNCKVYNKAILAKTDTITISCLNNNSEKVLTNRIVLTIHISNNKKNIQASL